MRWLRDPRHFAVAAAALVILGIAGAYGVLVLSTVTAPPAAELSAAPSRTPSPASPLACAGSLRPVGAWRGAEGPWVVAGGDDGGFVGYRAAEILAFDFIRSPNDAVARTTYVEGELEIAGSTLSTAQVTADILALRSDIEIRDGHLVEFLNLREHRNATFTLLEPIDLGPPVEGAVVDVIAHGSLSLLDRTREVDFPLHTRWNGDSIEVAGQLVIRRSDFGMDVPQLLGFRVAEEIAIELHLAFVRPGSDPCAPDPTAVAEASPGVPLESAAPSPTAVPMAFTAIDAWPEDSGDIAFIAMTDVSHHSPWRGELVVLGGGARAPLPITDTPGELEDDPAWSPDGSRLALARYPSERPPAIWVVDADGSDPRQIGPPDLRRPSWSPDGQALLAIPGTEDDTRIVVVDVASGEARTLLDDPGVEDGPRYSPDGARIVFSLLAEGANDEDLYLVNADGTGLTRLTTDPGYEYSPAWSPDGRELAFIRDGDLWRMAADGSGARRLTTGLRADAPTWSPDGRHLAFAVTLGQFLTVDENRRSIWLIDSDGTDLRRLDLQYPLVARPAWRP